MSADSESVSVPIGSINLDLNNPRTDPSHSQVEAIKRLFADAPDHVMGLAKDIAEHGLNPADLPIVTRSGNLYTVHEGNCRVAALLCIMDPDRAPEPHRRQFQALAKSTVVPSEINCVVFDSLDDARHWIELKHTNAKRGATRPWNARQKARFDRKPDPTHQLMEWFRIRASSDLAKKYSDGSIFSNIERLLDDPDARQRLGVEISSGEVKRLVSSGALVRALSRVVSDFTEADISRRKNVRDIYDKTKRAEYLSGIEDDLPKASDRAVAPLGLEVPDSKHGNTTGANASSSQSTTSSLLTARSTLVHRGARFNTAQARLDGIMTELRGLKLATKPNACAVLLRCLIEMCAAYYCTRKGLGAREGHGAFSANWQKAADHMLQCGAVTRSERAAMAKLVTDNGGALTYETLHHWVHSPASLPLAHDMIKIWATMWPFLQAVGKVKAK